jgi:hypothetical protein
MGSRSAVQLIAHIISWRQPWASASASQPRQRQPHSMQPGTTHNTRVFTTIMSRKRVPTLLVLTLLVLSGVRAGPKKRSPMSAPYYRASSRSSPKRQPPMTSAQPYKVLVQA